MNSTTCYTTAEVVLEINSTIECGRGRVMAGSCKQWRRGIGGEAGEQLSTLNFRLSENYQENVIVEKSSSKNTKRGAETAHLSEI